LGLFSQSELIALKKGGAMATRDLITGSLGVITKIEELDNYEARPIGPMEGSSGVRAGFSQMIGMLAGHTSMEGFRVETSNHELLVLIDDQASCCESWGHVHSADDTSYYLGAELLSIRLTDTALNSTIIDRHGRAKYGFDEGGIQFVDLDTSKGKLQLAVYNSHNGYYGHGIVVALDQKPLAEDTL
jgi:hypothetical protein